MKKPQAARFIGEVMTRMGAANPSELARTLGGHWLRPDAQRKLYKWNNGEQAPNFDSTFELLDAAGFLEGVKFSKPRQSQTPDPLAELRALVDETGKETLRALAGLEAQIGEIRDQLAPADPEATAEASDP